MFYKKVSRFFDALTLYHYGACKLARDVEVEVQVQDDQEEKMNIIALASTKCLESNLELILVSVGGLSHTVYFPCCWTQDTGRTAAIDLQ